jgi:hypothetical protein
MTRRSPSSAIRTTLAVAVLISLTASSSVVAQSVCLPAPRLLTTMPMGGQVGTTFDVTITGDNLENADELRFSHPGITATPKLDANGQPIANQFAVTITADCPAGLHEARLMTRLGVSSCRICLQRDDDGSVDRLLFVRGSKGAASRCRSCR